MKNWFKQKKSATPQVETTTLEPVDDVVTVAAPSVFSRLRQGLRKTRQRLGHQLGRLLQGKQRIDPELYEALETELLMADVGVATTKQLLQSLEDALSHRETDTSETAATILKQQMINALQPFESSLADLNHNTVPFVILMVGINGAGKTTSIGKLAKHYQAAGRKVMLAAGDTFRAAAVEQLQAWGERNKIPVISQASGADSASVLYDALQAAKARNVDVLIADTAGRLHTQTNLMEELKKAKRVLQKLDPAAPHEIMLVLDASTGQNGLQQARQFHHAIGVTGITLTKLDGTAKGGILFAIANELQLPFRYIGFGEGIDDLKPFNARHFVQAIWEDDTV